MPYFGSGTEGPDMQSRRVGIVGALVAVLVTAPSAASACSEMATDMTQATTNGLPVVEQQVLASSLPLLPFSGRTARLIVRVWGDLDGAEVPTRDDFLLLTWTGCRAPMEDWPGDRTAFQVWQEAGFVEAVEIVDAPGGLTEAQAQQLTAALGQPVITSPTTWQYVSATVWAWWPHLAILAALLLVFGALFDALRRVARRVATARERR